ncbi:MAG: A/G-specific adenine glycosylase [Prevotellaceae bacterium]|jgi:A/G-specific adenine glycosylase|nr:A/G-specific adenine glycosylase [Prevotellaceae bacterium]
MRTNNDADFFSKTLIKWFQQHRRELPWRDTKDPYRIWISEIILQQTRVNQGLAYYLRFMERFPDVLQLAAAPEDEVLKLWQGLGYYSRARNLHASAKIVAKQYNGIFPRSYKEIRALKGVGEYTAAAIASFAYNQAHAVVDGNVFRVLSRIFGINTPIDSSAGKKEFAVLAEKLLNPQDAGQHNQAIMEFGALQCLPASPDCKNCIFNSFCVAYLHDTVAQLPQKAQKIQRRERFFNYFFIKHNHSTFLHKRNANDVWRNLYEFPLIESPQALLLEDLMQTQAFVQLFEGIDKIEFTNKPLRVKHILSHQTIYATFYEININTSNTKLSEFLETNINHIVEYPVSRLMEIFLSKKEI